MADTKRLCVALGLALLGIPPLSGAASAPVIVAAHEDEEWHNDRQPPYDGSGWSESQGESPQVDFPSSGIDLRSWLSVTDFDASATAANDWRASHGWSAMHWPVLVPRLPASSPNAEASDSDSPPGPTLHTQLLAVERPFQQVLVPSQPGDIDLIGDLVHAFQCRLGLGQLVATRSWMLRRFPRLWNPHAAVPRRP